MITGLKVSDHHGNWRALTVRDGSLSNPERVIIYVQLLTLSAIDHGVDLTVDPRWEWLYDGATS